VADGADEVRLAAAGQAEGERVLAPLDEAALAESGQLLLDLGRQLGALSVARVFSLGSRRLV
jgi:hypothetical protein